MTKTDLVHVPYRGSSPAYPDLLTGKVHVLFGNLTGSIELVQAGRLRGLGGHVRTAVGDPCRTCRRSPRPCPATKRTSGMASWRRRARSREIVARLNKAINAGLADPELRARFEQAGGVPMPMSPAEFGKMIADETEKWRKVVQFAGVKVE